MILASGSAIRREMLHRAGVACDVVVPRVDEAALRAALEAEGATPRDIADALAEAKAAKVAARHPDRLVLGCDQVLDHRGRVLGKPESPEGAARQLRALSGDRHALFSAVVAFQDGRPVWRHVGQVRLTMRGLSAGYIDDYIARNWDSIRDSVGAYKLEEEGARFFTAIEGDYFTVLGLPLIPLLSWLIDRGTLPA
ncbi:Maf [Oceaniovalibus guishaninsula JLT2003]|uniref:Nucleoside triphosphate pyrophosphatase n=1 Tax=Oceaniovalibus guishaninsula JLT2003 TaxID=1231392 RepID=K2HP85_9RHOB|nr:Maf family nucleotide pyrophosphatase [Oceaniovalibus guishaninsula]EKE44674.1 Maf [Oceaniovalibus guishaninsula JLT2003]